MKLFRVIILYGLIGSQANHACEGCLDGLASPRGLAIVATVYAAAQAISNFMWAFRWSKHTDCSEETSLTIQEWGGLTASIENLALGVLIPVIVYLHQQNQRQADEI
jgi:hypothetical protein